MIRSISQSHEEWTNAAGKDAASRKIAYNIGNIVRAKR